MKHYRLVLWLLALVGLCADQASKYNVFAWLAHVENHTFWIFQAGPHTGFALETRYTQDPVGPGDNIIPHVNQGALFCLGRDYETQANWGFAFVSLLAAAAIVYWSFRPGVASDLWVCTALGLILGGTLGNLYDRVVFNGVRDFLHWNYMFDWPVFNIADSCLVCGACLLLLQAFGKQPVATDDKAQDTSAATAQKA